ncbi:MAG: DUF302 domain-containing protein [Granulosicoccaceae bacterium]
MKKWIASMAMCLAFSAQASEGVLQIESAQGVTATADKLEQILLSKGMKIMARVPHSQAASGVGIDLRDTELLIFGNPKAGSPLMKCQQLIALDLPQKALIYADEAGKTWIAYNNPMYLKQRHQVEGCDKPLEKIAGALSKLTAAAAKAE